MKNTFIAFIFILTCLLNTGCKDYLEKQPLGETILGNITTEEQAVLFVNAAYEPLLWGRGDPMQGHYFNDMWILGDLMSDDTETPVDPNNINERELQDFNVFADNPNLRDWFGSGFVGIARCNVVINSLSNASDDIFKTAGVKNRCLGGSAFSTRTILF